MRVPTLSSRLLIVSKLFFLISVWTVTATGQSSGVDLAFNAVPELDYDQTLSFTLQPDNKVLIFGNFDVVDGQVTNRIVRFNPDSTLDTTFNCMSCDFRINSAVVQADGKIIVAGSVMTTVGQPRIYRLNADGSRDSSFGIPFPDVVFPVTAGLDVHAVQPDGKILVVYHFQAGTGYSSTLYRLLPNGTVDPSFTAVPGSGGSGGTFGQTLGAVALLADGKILVATNSFANCPGCTPGLATLRRYNPDGTRDESFEAPNASVPSGAPDFLSGALINDLDVKPDGSIVIVGRFSAVNGVSRTNIAMILPAGNVDLSFAPVIVPEARRIRILTDGRMLIGTSAQIFRYNSDGTIDPTYNSPADLGVIRHWTLDSSGKVFLQETRFVRLSDTGSFEFSFSPHFGMTGTVATLAVAADGKVILAGQFARVNNIPQRSIARVNADGSIDTTFNIGSGFNGQVRRILLQTDGKILAIGQFAFYDGVPRSSIARLNIDGSIDTTFDPTTNALFTINAIALDADGKILIGGIFTSVNGQTRTGLARLNADGSLDATFDPVFGTPSIAAITVQPDGKIMVGGFFNGVNGFSRKNLVRLNSDGTLDTTFNATNTTITTSAVSQIETLPDGRYFIRISNTIMRLDAAGAVDPSFVSPTGLSFDNPLLYILAQPDGSVIAAGRFLLINGAARSNIVRLSSNGALDPLFLPDGANAAVRVLARYGSGQIMAGGDFSSIGSVTRMSIARLNVMPFRFNTQFDFEGDGRADVSVFRPSNGYWYQLRSGDSSFYALQFGQAGDRLAAADYDGDGRTDIAVFRDVVPGAGNLGYFYIINSADGSITAVQFGSTGDVPVSGDWDGDGKADLAVYRDGTGAGGQSYFYYRPSGTAGVDFRQIVWGNTGDKPVVGDFDGDGKIDAAVVRPSNTFWYILKSSNGQAIQLPFGLATDIPAPADFNGDGVTNIAVFRPSTGFWYTSTNPQANYGAVQFGASGDIPVPADYDGDGKADVAVFRPSNGSWYMLRSTSGFTAVQFGTNGDKPVPNGFIP